MRVDDGVLFYHSNCDVPGIYGIAEVASTAYPDPTQFQKKSKYHDAKATQEQPRWFLVDVGRSEEHTSELQSLMRISYAVFCLKKKKTTHKKSSTKIQMTKYHKI